MLTMCLGVPGKVVRIFREHDVLMGKIDFSGIVKQVCLEHVPIVITGFEPVNMLEGVLMTVRQLEAGEARVENQYARAVRPDGNQHSRELIEDVFEICDRKWRGVGIIPKSGLKLRYYRDHDAERIFEVDDIQTEESTACISGQVLKGLKKPHDCPAFGKTCTPQSPLGATMVSNEGACAAYYIYRRHLGSRNRSRHATAPQLVQLGVKQNEGLTIGSNL